MKKITMKSLFAAIIVLIMVFAMTACGGQGQSADGNGAGDSAAELSPDQIDSLMWQISDQQEDLLYKEYMPDMWFANAEIFGVDRDGDNGTAYVELCTDEFVVLKDKAYIVSGSQGPAIIKFEYTDEEPKLTEVIWSADGEEQEAWLKENFPADYLKKAKKYNAYGSDGKSFLVAENEEAAEKEMGVPVETENLLSINLDEGTYEIFKTIESGEGEDYKFDTETIEKGNLGD